MSTRARINEHAEVCETAILLIGPEVFDEAIIGVSELTGLVVYDRMLVIELLMSEGMDREEAEEYFYYNMCSPCSEGWPIFIDRRIAE